MEDQNYLKELHQENVSWKKEILFVKDEIKTYKNRLAEVVTKNTKTEILALAEHFQNQFIRHSEVMDELLHDVNKNEHKVARRVQSNNVATDHRNTVENTELVDRMNMFHKIYGELKDEYLAYLSKVL